MSSWDRKRLAAAIVQTRDKLGWSQSDLANISKIGLTTIQRMELSAGKKAPYPARPSTFYAIERGFGWPEGHIREIAEDGAAPLDPRPAPKTAATTDVSDATPPDDAWIREVRQMPITEEARQVLIETYLRDQARDDAQRQEKYEREKAADDAERRERYRRLSRAMET